MSILRWRRKLLIAAGSIALVVAIVILIAPTIARPIVRDKVQAVLSQHLRGRFEMGTISYSFPWNVTVRDVRVIATDPDGEKPFELFGADRIAVSLAHAPFGAAPLALRELKIDSPRIHVIETPAGLVGLPDETRSGDEPDAQVVSGATLSDRIRFGEVTLAGAQVTYEDRTTSVPAVVTARDVNVKLHQQPDSTAGYHFDASGVTTGPEGAVFSGNGVVDIDRRVVLIDQSSLTMKLDSQAFQAAPARLRERLNDVIDAGLVGRLTVHLTGEIPMRDPQSLTVRAAVDLSDASLTLPDSPGPLDQLTATLVCTAEPLMQRQATGSTALTASSLPLFKVSVRRIFVGAGENKLAIEGGDLVINPSSGAWGASDVKVSFAPGKDFAPLPKPLRRLLDGVKPTGSVHCTLNGSGPLQMGRDALDQINVDGALTHDNVTLSLRELPLPLHDFEDTAFRLADGVATLGPIRAGYGQDVFFLEKVSVPLKALPDALLMDNLSGCITFGKQSSEYPTVLGVYLTEARPRGSFWFSGKARIDFVTLALDYRIRVTSDRAGISTLRHHIPLYNVRSDLMLTPAAIEISRFDANALSGTIATTGRIDLKDDTVGYAAQVRIRQLDLNSLAQLSVDPGGKPITVSGELGADITLSGKGTTAAALDVLRAEGVVQVDRAELFRVPVLKDIVAQVLGSVATVSEAMCTFKLSDGVVHVSEVAIGSPAVGIRGSGTVGLDQSLDLEVIATALSDWEKQIRRNDNAVSNVAATIAGAVQNGLNKVTEDFLYRVHVTGTVNEPQVNVIAVPALQKKQ